MWVEKPFRVPGVGSSSHTPVKEFVAMRTVILVVALALLSLAPGGAAAPREGKVPYDRVRFDTLDGVELQGAYYPSSRGKKAACVLLLPALTEGSRTEDWDEVARRLQQHGFAVLHFDFRG